jgi:hypothetical protein
LTLDFFCAIGFLRPLGPNEIKSSIPNDHVSRVADDKTLVRVSTIATITRANVRV